MKQIVPIVTKKDLEITSPIKIIETAKKGGKKISLATKVDDAFIQMLFDNQENVGKFIDLEIDPSTNILTLHFEKKDIELEKELAHEMR